MSYLHIKNLYRQQEILMFRECFSTEKIHGSSSHVGWSQGKLTFFSGGAKHVAFTALFDAGALTAAFTVLGYDSVTVYGEVYGGSMQGMKDTYGPALRFVAFDVKVGTAWLNVPNAYDLATLLKLDFVPWTKVEATVEALNAERDKPSEIAVRLGITEPRPREGIVVRPLIELTKNNGERIIVKHKSDAFAERLHTPKVTSIDKLPVLTAANAIADEWVVEQRMIHVLDKLTAAGKDVTDIKTTPLVVSAMIEDVMREAAGEIVDSKDVRRAIGTRAAKLFTARIKSALLPTP